MSFDLIGAYNELKKHEDWWTFDNRYKDYWRILKDSVEDLKRCGSIDYAIDIAKFLMKAQKRIFNQ